MTPDENALRINNNLQTFFRNNNLLPIALSGQRFKRLSKWLEWVHSKKNTAAGSYKSERVGLTWSNYSHTTGCYSHSEHSLSIETALLPEFKLNEVDLLTISQAKRLKIRIWHSYYSMWFSFHS